ncbi:MAG: YdcF family protein [Betaproteobacteria bacterium]|nr:YdcF family protein [Betaproteobacteria bacterium]MCL2887535.1 YdcF family protein [Betaproteobacteria bacterium]
MSTAWFLKNLLSTLLLPPANGLLLLALAGLFRRRRWAFAVALAGALLLLAQSLPPLAGWLNRTLEEQAGPVFSDPQGAGAIVILAGGVIEAAEYGGETPNQRSLVRARYGAVLARQHQLPVLVSGGLAVDSRRAEADVIADVLENEFGIAVRWRETRSRDTADNAVMSAELLQAAGIRRVVLVTQAFHMPRARRLFAAAGVEVVPAPTELGQYRVWPESALGWLPQAGALHASYYALHEWLGLAWLDVQALLRREES